MAKKKGKPVFITVVAVIAKGLWFAVGYSFAILRALFRIVRKYSARAKPISVLKPRKRGSVTHKPVFEQFVHEAVSGDYEDFSDSLNNRSQIILLFGKRGSGKSALALRLMENIRAVTGKPCFVFGISRDLLPDWISSISSLEEVQNGSVVLVDEGAIEFSARESMMGKNVSLGKMLAVARHKDLTLLFITQNTGMIDKYVLNLADIIIAKEGSLLQKQMERPVLKNFIGKADSAIKSLPKEKRVMCAYVFSDDFEGTLNFSLPSFWSQSISKSRRQ